MAKKEKPKYMETIESINKHYGSNIVKLASEMPEVTKVRTSDLSLDYVLGGGFPISRIVEFLGDEHTGKTRDAYKIIEAFQKTCVNCRKQDLKAEWSIKGGFPTATKMKCSCKNPKAAPTIIVDFEKTTDLDYMQTYFDIDISGIYIVVPEMPSQLIDIVEALLRDPEIGLVLVDSIGMISSDSEINKAQKDIKMDEGARFMNRAIRKWQAALNSNFNESNGQSITSLLLINRTYETLSLYSAQVPQGGRGLRHAKSISIDRRIKEKVKTKEGQIIGVHRQLKNLKNKAGFPYRVFSDYLFTDERDLNTYMKVNEKGQLIDFALLFGLIEIKGGWYYYGENKFHGRAEIEAKIYDTDLPEKVKQKIYEKA